MPNRMDSIVSHGLGKMKGVKARLSGLVGVFQTLAEQHGEAASLLERAKSSDEKFTQLWPQIRRELLSHEKAELREVYPVLRSFVDLESLVAHHAAEAAELEQMIHRLDTLDPAIQERRDLFQQLIDSVIQHASEEEHDIFPKAQDAIGKERAHALDGRFLAAKRALVASV